ncbi:MAG TPA: hypothetical protein VFZ75_02810 [Actinomycetota bacterium]|nr:hypothetical protein [Actinomycetota bacterium]
MKPWARWAIVGGTVVGLTVLFVLLRPDDTTDGASPTPSTPTPIESPSENPSPTQEGPSPSPEPTVTLIDVTYRNGAVQGPTRYPVTQGDDVRIVVHADVSDEVHLHGYDLSDDVTPDRPARIEFVADAAGVYECELESAETLLFQLEIVP